MSTSTEVLVKPLRFLLSKDDLLPLAYNAIKPTPCEWEGCQIVLNSWQTLSKHLLRHCSCILQQVDGMYHCRFSRCSGRLHSSLRALKSHVELSHLSRVSLPCPIRDCDAVIIRVPQLETHFEEVHREDFGDHVPTHSIVPQATPAIPTTLVPPPPLPSFDVPSHTMMVSVIPSKRRASQTSLDGTSRLPRKWSRLNVQDDGDEDHSDVVFNDLPSLKLSKGSADPITVEVSKKSVDVQAQLSRPQRVISPRVSTDDVPDSILYPTFSRRVDRLVADGILK
ncbi:hypothetical protein EDC04DRAFT_2643766 [Pisolithus marmoratus]|nr:hypothetical protein EDC04DRAFT_2643766 [Pisolithus marmoratus]